MKKKWFNSIIITSILIIIGAYIALQLWLNMKAKLAVDNIIIQLKPYAQIHYQSVATNIWTGMVYLNKVHIQPMHNVPLAITITKLGIKSESNAKGFITHLKLNLQDITLPVEFADIYPLARQILHSYPKPYLNGSFFIDYQFNPIHYQMRMLILTNVKQFGILEAKLLSQPYHPHFMSALDFTHLPLLKLQLLYHDRSLANKLWKVLSAHQGKPVIKFKKEVLYALDSRLKTVNDPATQHSIIALKQFVKKPDKLQINLISLQPISLYQIYNLPAKLTAPVVHLQILSSSAK